MASSKGSGYTPTDFQPAKYQLVGGVDSKTHGLTLPPPKLQTCQNAFADRTGSLSRRYGRSALASTDRDGAAITSWRATAAYQGRLIGFTGKKLYDYSAGAGRWADGKRATSWRVRSSALDAGDAITGALAFPVGGCRDMAVSLSGFRLYAYDYYETRGAAIFTRTAIALLDPQGTRLASNLVLSQNSAVAGSISSVRVVAHASRFYVVYGDAAGLGALKCFIVDLTSAATIATSLAASPTTLAGDLLHGTITPLDVCDDIWHGPFVCYVSTTANTIKTGFVTTAGALTATNSISSGAADAATISCDAINLGTNNTLLGVAFGLSTHPNDIYAALRSYNGTAWTSVATSGAMDTALTASQNRAVVCKFDSVTTLRVFYDNDTNVTARCIRQGTFTTAGTIAPRVARLNRSYLASKPFYDPDGQMMVWVYNDSFTEQPTMFLMTIGGVVAGVALQGDAAVPLGTQPWGLGHVVSDAGGTSFSVFCQSYVRFGTEGVGAFAAWRDITIDTAHDQSYAAVQDGGCLYIPSAVLLQYDGISCTESGFLQYVETASIVPVPSNGAGSLTNSAIYGIRIIPEWPNAQGEREQGTDNGPVTVTMGAADDTLTTAIPTIPWTLKQYSAITDVVRPNLVFAVYRTLPNPTDDSPHYRAGTIANDPTADTVTFVDLMSDAVLATQEQLKADTELDGTAPAPGYIVAAGNGRVFLAGLPDDPNLVMYSKTRGHGEPLTFNDALTIPVPTASGAITGLAVQNDSLAIFTERAIYRVNGPGLSNTGTAGGFTDPILVTTDDGAVGPRSIIATPGGVMFDATARGISILTQSFSTEYIGAPLEKLADPGVCTGTAILPALQQVRFSFASVTYVYDYFHGQWYTFTHGSVGPTAVWNHVHAAVDTDIVYDDSTVWTDAGDPYTMELKLGWLTSQSTLLANLRVRSLGLVGQSLAAHNLAINVGYDQAAATELLETSISGAGPLAPQWRLSQQRCYAIEVTIRDALLDVYLADVVQNTAGMRLNELAFEIGLVNPRLNRYDTGAAGGGNSGPIGI